MKDLEVRWKQRLSGYRKVFHVLGEAVARTEKRELSRLDSAVRNPIRTSTSLFWGTFPIRIGRILNDLDDLLLPYKTDLSLYKNIRSKELKDHIDRVGSVIYGRGMV